MAIVEAAVKKDLGVETNLSEEYLNYQTKKAGYFPTDEGSVVNYNLMALKASGILLESDWGYQPSWFNKDLPCAQYKKTDENAPKNCFSHNRPTDDVMEKLIAADGLELISVASNTNEVIKFLANEKRPLTFGLNVNENGWPKSGDVFYNDALRKECLKNPDSCGGHAMTLTGYDLDKKVFFFKNSWGKEWGHEGYGTVTFDTVDRFSSGKYFSVKFNGTLDLPTDNVIDTLSVKAFSVKSKLEKNHSISIKAIGELQGAAGHTIYVSSYLIKKAKTSLEAPNDQNSEIVALSEGNASKFNNSAVRSTQYYLPDSHNESMLWDAKTPINLDLSAEMMGIPEVTQVLSSTKDKAFLRTTIYSFTDTGYKTLKRIYKPYDQL